MIVGIALNIFILQNRLDDIAIPSVLACFAQNFAANNPAAIEQIIGSNTGNAEHPPGQRIRIKDKRITDVYIGKSGSVLPLHLLL